MREGNEGWWRQGEGEKAGGGGMSFECFMFFVNHGDAWPL